MKINIEKSLKILFVLGLFFFSFNQVEMFPFMGEYVREFGASFFLLGFAILCFDSLKTGKLYLPYNNLLYQLLILFFSLCIICSLVNFNDIITNYFKRTTGISRLIRQLISISIPIFVFIPFYWRVIKDKKPTEVFYLVRKIFLATLLFASFYSFWEIFSQYYYPASYFFKVIDILPFMDHHFHDGGRISSIAYEVPFFAIFLISISGWMFSYIITGKNIITKLTPTLLILILTFFSGSRTGLLVVFFIFCLFIAYLFKNNYYRKQIKFSFLFLIICSLLITIKSEKIKHVFIEKIESLDFAGNLKTDISNKTRFGMQTASIQVFKQNPIFGVGFGQQAYHTQFYYPRWATKDNYEFDLIYKNKKDPSFPPGYNLYTRILAEMGIIGLISWLSILIYSLVIIKKLLRLTKDPIIKVTLISIFISLVGLYINWLQIDTFRMYGVWINLAILIKLTEYYKNKKHV